MRTDVSRREFLADALAAGAGATVAGCATAPKDGAAAGPHVPGTGKIPYRVFWTWDNSMVWGENVPGAQTSGIGNAYTMPADWFVRGYRRSVDWCAAHGVDAVGIVGLLRDCHGGIDSARRICGYAREKGVRVYLISGLYTYGGVYYEGESKWSMIRFFREHPECVGRQSDGQPLQYCQKGHHGDVRDVVGCPSSDLLNRYILDSLEWVFKAIPELGGIQMETGDTRVCWCDRCRARRGDKAIEEGMSVEDMMAMYPAAVDAVRAASPDAWIMCETYHHFNDEPCRAFSDPAAQAESLAKIAAMPKDVFWQWKCDRQLFDGTWKFGDRLPQALSGFRHMMRAHSGTQWWGGRGAWAVLLVRQQCRLSYGSGICGVSLFGEVSPYAANAEFNYLALRYFADNPLATMREFGRDVMAPLLGGDDFAEKWIAYAPLQNDTAKVPKAVDDISRFLPSIRDREALRRWLWLANHLSSYRWNDDRFRDGRKRPAYTNISPLV